MSAEVTITDPRAVPPPGWRTLKAYVELTKPRIIELLLVTTLPAMVVADGGWPGTWLAVATLIGGTLSAGGANAINNVLDSDIDVVMARTSGRPLPTARIKPRAALIFGVGLGAAGFLWLWLFVNLLAGLLSTAGLLFYVFIYTMLLKRTSTQNIVIGGAAGSVPPLVGWAAVTGSLAVPAWVMFAIVFFWTPPHFWALSLRYEKEYAEAGVPMMPVVVGSTATIASILRYSILLAGVSLLLFPAGLGLPYLVAASALGAVFIREAWRLNRSPETAMRFFGFSNLYLATLFVAMAVDAVVT